MPDRLTSRDWRNRAEEYRVFAVSARRPESRDVYFKLVESCEQMADRLERTETQPPDVGNDAGE